MPCSFPAEVGPVFDEGLGLGGLRGATPPGEALCTFWGATPPGEGHGGWRGQLLAARSGACSLLYIYITYLLVYVFRCFYLHRVLWGPHPGSLKSITSRHGGALGGAGLGICCLLTALGQLPGEIGLLRSSIFG